jgi:hypothetical protein
MQVLLLLPEQSCHRVPGDVCFEAEDQTGSSAVDAAGKIASGVFPLLLASPLDGVVIVTHIWQKLSNVEHKKMLIVTHYWQLFSQIIGETSLIVRNIWRNRTAFREQVSS